MALPDGEFVAVWLADRATTAPVAALRDPLDGGDWSAPDDRRAINCCPGIDALEAAGDGSVTVVVARTRASRRSNTQAAPAADWGRRRVRAGAGSGSDFAAAPDGSAVAVAHGDLQRQPDCIDAAYRPPGGAVGRRDRRRGPDLGRA